MSNQTFESQAHQGFADLLRTAVFPAIVQGFTQKGVATSIDELSQMCKLQAPAQRPTGLTSSFSGPPAVPGMTGMPFGAPVPNASGRSTTKKQVDPSNACLYKLTRGANKGQLCGKPRTDDLFCKDCAKKSTAEKQRQELMANGGVPTSSQPAAGGFPPGMNQFAGQMMGGLGGGIPPVSGMPAVSQAPKTDRTLNVVEVSTGIYRDVNKNYMIKNGTQPGSYVCFGVQDANGKTVPLNAQQIEDCKSMGLSYVDNSADSASSNGVQTGVSLPNQQAGLSNMGQQPQQAWQQSQQSGSWQQPGQTMPALGQQSGSWQQPQQAGLPSANQQTAMGLPNAQKPTSGLPGFNNGGVSQNGLSGMGLPGQSDMGQIDDPDVEEEGDENDDE